MAKMTFGSKGGRVRAAVRNAAAGAARPAADVVRELKAAQQKPPGEDYRERSLAIHGLVCAHCGREFAGANRQLLTVHHKDGNHHHNPPDGSNWENLCVYCHENIHSREILGDYLSEAGAAAGNRETVLVFRDGGRDKSAPELNPLAEKLRAALAKKQQ